MAQLVDRLVARSFYLAVFVILYAGWRVRGEEYLTAEEGPGYVLGIVGGTLMLLLLVYPLRKRLRSFRLLGPVRYWFRMHMVFGVVGPALILFHANFGLGSLNSSVALLAMSVVAASGFIGRYLYTKIHRGLYGRLLSMRALLGDVGEERDKMERMGAAIPRFTAELEAFSADVSIDAMGLWRSWLQVLTMAWRTRLAQRRLKRLIDRHVADLEGLSQRDRRRARRDALCQLAAYMQAVRRVVELTFYERLFTLWHVLHLPLFVMLIIAGVVHVVAVHMY